MLDTSKRRSKSLNLLSIPYDIRFLIYQHLFPSPPQIYLQARNDSSVVAMIAEGTVSTGLLRTCRAIHAEAAGFLYNTYLFNIIGTKEDCLRSHKEFLQNLQKYARDEVHINAFSNGIHSDTMCISLHTGNGKMGILRGRRRGVETTLNEIQEEIQAERSASRMSVKRLAVGLCWIVSLLIVLVGWALQKYRSG